MVPSLMHGASDSPVSGLKRLALPQTSCGRRGVRLGVIRDSNKRVVGTLEGLIVAPAQRTIRSFVVRSTGRGDQACYLLPMSDVSAQFNGESHCLEIEIGQQDVRGCGEGPMDPGDYAEFGDDDLLDCLFRSRTM
jgi:hypothetical protein